MECMRLTPPSILGTEAIKFKGAKTEQIEIIQQVPKKTQISSRLDDVCHKNKKYEEIAQLKINFPKNTEQFGLLKLK